TFGSEGRFAHLASQGALANLYRIHQNLRMLLRNGQQLKRRFARSSVPILPSLHCPAADVQSLGEEVLREPQAFANCNNLSACSLFWRRRRSHNGHPAIGSNPALELGGLLG